MITGWLGCVTVAIIMARYGRDQYRDTTLFNLKVWFVVSITLCPKRLKTSLHANVLYEQVHRVLMALAWCLIIAAYICILIYTKKFQVVGLVWLVTFTYFIDDIFRIRSTVSRASWPSSWRRCRSATPSCDQHRTRSIVGSSTMCTGLWAARLTFSLVSLVFLKSKIIFLKFDLWSQW